MSPARGGPEDVGEWCAEPVPRSARRVALIALGRWSFQAYHNSENRAVLYPIKHGRVQGKRPTALSARRGAGLNWCRLCRFQNILDLLILYAVFELLLTTLSTEEFPGSTDPSLVEDVEVSDDSLRAECSRKRSRRSPAPMGVCASEAVLRALCRAAQSCASPCLQLLQSYIFYLAGLSIAFDLILYTYGAFSWVRNEARPTAPRPRKHALTLSLLVPREGCEARVQPADGAYPHGDPGLSARPLHDGTRVPL
jgi:hypothetical protein